VYLTGKGTCLAVTLNKLEIKIFFAGARKYPAPGEITIKKL